MLQVPIAEARDALEIDGMRAEVAKNFRDKNRMKDVLRAAGIYGPWRGLHRRVLEGRHALPDGGHRVVSRVHVDDLAALMDACLARGLRGATFVVADECPVPQREAVAWAAGEMEGSLGTRYW